MYSYRCPRCGTFDLRCDLGEAPAAATCPECAQQSKRVFTPPLLSRTPRPVADLRTREEASRSEPEVVSAPPAALKAPRPAAPNPAQARLPRN
ncbi:MAG TPA: zinc ribbon domain-containing protein [Pseudonocardiaceae bacterium]|nr:zinc ribbon domain-containing protein [Pseudonocardiaceae bacterium]